MIWARSAHQRQSGRQREGKEGNEKEEFSRSFRIKTFISKRWVDSYVRGVGESMSDRKSLNLWKKKRWKDGERVLFVFSLLMEVQ